MTGHGYRDCIRWATAYHAGMQMPHDPTARHRLCVAPMMDWTDRYCRAMLRALTRHTRLYTEMVPAAALQHGAAPGRFLDFDPVERPLALQIGTADPAAAAHAARLAADWGYDEINLNAGCPSDRVQSGRFGACLMREPALVAEICAAMRAASDVPVTVKHRLGIDDLDDADSLHGFVETVAEAGVEVFIVHARKAWLNGLSPKQNRDIPPLQYDRVFALKRAFPHLRIVLNGGLRTLDQAETHGSGLNGTMLGRAAYETPMVLLDADRRVFGAAPPARDLREVLTTLLPLAERVRAAGQPLGRLTRHMMGLMHGRAGARQWRRHLTGIGQDKSARLPDLQAAIDAALSADAHYPEAVSDSVDAA